MLKSNCITCLRLGCTTTTQVNPDQALAETPILALSKAGSQEWVMPSQCVGRVKQA